MRAPAAAGATLHVCCAGASRRSLRALATAAAAAGAPPPPPPASALPPLPPLRPFQEVALPEPLRLVHGGSLADICIRVEVLGDPSLPLSRTVVVFPSFSHSAHVAGHTDDPAPGWWQDMVGPGLAIDTRHFRVVCASNLGSPFSPTNPSAARGSDGRPLRARFPTLSPTDLANCHARVLARLFGEGVLTGSAPGGRLHALVGASLGGMQALQFASLYPRAAARLLAVATTGRTTPFSCAIRSTQRAAILADPDWAGGDYEDASPPRAPARGLRAARELGTMFYRSRAEFDARFQWAPGAGTAAAPLHWASPEPTWEVQAYLAHAGKKFVRAFDANAYLLLSYAMDLQDLGDGWAGRSQWAEGARRIASGGGRALLVGIRQDAHIPPAELRALAAAINGGGGGGGAGGGEGGAPPQPPAAEFLELDSELGHDAFLVPRAVPELQARARSFLEEGLESSLVAESALVGGPVC